MPPGSVPPTERHSAPDTAAKRSPVWGVLVILLFLGVSIFAAFRTAGPDGFACWLIGAMGILITREAWRLLR